MQHQLKDTVIPYNESADTGYGFSFRNYNVHDMLFTIRRAVSFYYEKNIWNKLIKRAMGLDFSWDASAQKY